MVKQKLFKNTLTTLVIWLPLLILVTLNSEVAAQDSDRDFRAADTSSPRATLQSFIDACNEFHELVASKKYYDPNESENRVIVERALDCLDESEFAAFARREHAAEAAIQIKEILDRVALPAWEDIPDEKAIKAAAEDSREKTHYRIPNTRITIARVEQGPRRYEYLFSPGTVERAEPYFNDIASQPYRDDGPQVSNGLYRWYVSAPGHPVLATTVDGLPEFLRIRQTFGVTNWKWIFVIVSIFLATLLVVFAFRAFRRFAEAARQRGLVVYWLTLVFPVIVIVIPIMLKNFTYRYLMLRGLPQYAINFVSILIALLAGLVLIFAMSNRIAATIIASPRINPAGLNANVIRILSKLSALVASTALFIVGGQYLGIPVTTLLTSAGIGGLAVALGAQDSLKSLFGTLSLVTDKPFQVGDRIMVDEFDGVVEDVGLRSSRLNLLNGNNVSIPNDRLADSEIENVGRRKFIRRVGEVHLPLDSAYETVKQAAEIIRGELENHEGMNPDHPPRVFFDEFDSDAFTIKFYYWYSPPDFWKYKAFGDKFNFEVLRKFGEQGIQFSLPLRHSFWKHDSVQGPLDVSLVERPTTEP